MSSDFKDGLLLLCTGPGGPNCAEHIPVQFGLNRDKLTMYLNDHRWFLSVLTPSGQGSKVPIIFGPICEDCAERVMPEVTEAARKQMKKRKV